MSKISLKHSGGNVVSLNSPTNAPGAADVAFKLPNQDGSASQALITDGSGNLSFASVAGAGKATNLIINGAMQVAQRGTSSNLEGYHTVDRFRLGTGGVDEHPTQAQVDVAAGTTPYTLGFRKALKITNGNQTSGAGANDDILIHQKIEAQNIATSGWNYTSSSSFITLSFWVKSSVAQNFYGFLLTEDGTAQSYPFETGSLTADTWTKITKTIPGNSNLQFDNDNNIGLEVIIGQFFGTDKTGSVSLNAWGAYSSSTRTPDFTSTWYTTNDATFEITGVQLEVGSVATDFEHRVIGEELALCQRYFWKPSGSTNSFGFYGGRYGNSHFFVLIYLPTTMRTAPTVSGTPGVSGTSASASASTELLQYYISNSTSNYITYSTVSADAEL